VEDMVAGDGAYWLVWHGTETEVCNGQTVIEGMNGGGAHSSLQVWCLAQ